MNTANLRSRYRINNIGAGYSGVRNVVCNLAVCALLMLASAAAMGRLSWTGAALLVVTTILFNAIEYAFHRWLSHTSVMMNSFRLLVAQHHVFFVRDTMTSEHLSKLLASFLPSRSFVELY